MARQNEDGREAFERFVSEETAAVREVLTAMSGFWVEAVATALVEVLLFLPRVASRAWTLLRRTRVDLG